MYYEHGALWENFFKTLGCEIVVSTDTNKAILDMGVNHCSNETCLPVKVFHGHVLSLMDKADYIFIPRYVTLGKDAFCCPKLCGLPDMTMLNLKNCSNIIEVLIDIRGGIYKAEPCLRDISEKLSIPFSEVKSAYLEFLKQADDENKPIALKTKKQEENRQAEIAVLGHPYMIYDSYLCMNLQKKLSSKGIRVITPSDLNGKIKKSFASPFLEKAFWSIGYDTLGSAFAFAEKQNIKGMIYLTPFACGIDSLVTEFIERRLKSKPQLHYMKITMDEHTGEAGFNTRLEAFLDMIPDCS